MPIDRDRTVTASFVRVQHQVTVVRSGSGSGKVSSAPAGITCGASCSALFAATLPVTLTADPGDESKFGGWSIAGCEAKACTFTVAGDETVTATFDKASANSGDSEGGGGPNGDAPQTEILKATIRGERRRARFVFDVAPGSRPASRFECRLDRGPYEQCESPRKLRRLDRGGHVFRVVAVGGGTRDPTPAKQRFKISG